MLAPVASAGFAFVAALLLTPLVRWGALQQGGVAHPEAGKWHKTPTALFGGIAIVGAGAGALALGNGGAAFSVSVWGGGLLLFVAGLIDDVWGLGPAAKLTAQAGAAGLVLSAGHLFLPEAPLWLSGPLTGVWLLGLPNAVNLLDAMDGVAASVVALAAAFFGGVAALQGNVALAAAAASVGGAAAGFLVYNAPPARIFMGDCGSLVLGYVLAVLGLAVQEGAAPVPALVPILIVAVPLFDTTFVSLTRTWRGQSVTNGGTDHTMHRLTRLRWSERQVPWVLGGGGGVAGAIALVAQLGTPVLFYALALGAGGVAVALGRTLARHTAPVDSPPPAPPSSERTPPVGREKAPSPAADAQRGR